MKHPRHWLYWFAGLGVVLALAATATEHARAQSLGEGGNYGLIAPFSGGAITSPLLTTVSASNSSAPGYAFSGYSTTGWGFDGTTIYAINQGTRVFYASTTAAAFDVPMLMQPGSASAPSFSFLSATNSGMFYGSSSVKFAVGGTTRLTLGTYVNEPTHTPATSSEACTTGDRTWDASFEYRCTTTNTWKRAALSSF